MKTKVNNKKIVNDKAETKVDKMRQSRKPATATKSDVTLEEEYRRNFLQDAIYPVRSNKTAYVREEHHEKIIEFIRMVHKGKLTLSGYIDHVLTQHFQTYRGVMSKMYEEARSKRDCKF